jgi:calcineurin-like phosphoesterase family protein
MSRIHFTADLHLYHAGILRVGRQDWLNVSNIVHMHDKLIHEWNENVDVGDTVYVIGDLTFSGTDNTAAILRLLKGNIKLIPGNHDDMRVMRRLEERGLIELMPPIVSLKVETQRIIMCHYPLESWANMHYGSWMLHGHCHGHLNHIMPLRKDVGWDAVQMVPVSLAWLDTDFAWQRPAVVDHHYLENV